MRDYSVRGIPADELERTRRELAASLALARPGSPVRVPIEASLNAIETELDARRRIAGERLMTIRLCSCGFATDDADWLAGHLFEHPGHGERVAWWSRALALRLPVCG